MRKRNLQTKNCYVENMVRGRSIEKNLTFSPKSNKKNYTRNNSSQFCREAPRMGLAFRFRTIMNRYIKYNKKCFWLQFKGKKKTFARKTPKTNMLMINFFRRPIDKLKRMCTHFSTVSMMLKKFSDQLLRVKTLPQLPDSSL